MKALFNLVQGIIIFTLTFVFLRWYIKGHFGKYFIFFWINTIISCYIYYDTKTNQPIEDNTPGYVYFERNMNN